MMKGKWLIRSVRLTVAMLCLVAVIKVYKSAMDETWYSGLSEQDFLMPTHSIREKCLQICQ
jgi:hypothetical protein